MVSTRPARRASRSAQPASGRAKPVEPDRDEGAVRVETTHTRKARTHPSSPDTRKRFRHDPLADTRRSAQPTSGRTKPVEPDRDEGAVRVETTWHPVARTRPQLPGHPRHGFDTTRSLTLAGRLNQLGDEMVSIRPAQPTSGRTKPVDFGDAPLTPGGSPFPGLFRSVVCPACCAGRRRRRRRCSSRGRSRSPRRCSGVVRG